jgi:hypothetical protein
MNGRHRTAAVKGLGDQFSIRALEDTYSKPPILIAWSHEDIREILQRQEAGLFKLEVLAPKRLTPGDPFELYASWNVISYSAPWVFSKEMEETRRLLYVSGTSFCRCQIYALLH